MRMLNALLKSSQERTTAKEHDAVHNSIVPYEFENVVLGHIYNNRLFPETAALILVIVGSSGSGKSFNVEQTCRSFDIFCKFTTGATFQGNEGAPRRQFQTAYKEALAGAGVHLDKVVDRISPDHPSPTREAVLLIDDLHLSLASQRSDNFSQNTQLFQSTLMSACDDPCSIFELDSRFGPSLRVPIIATTNATSEVYQPLLRHGRARLFEWKPTPENNMQAAQRLLFQFARESTEGVITKYRNEIPAFFRELVSRAREELIIRCIRRGSPVVRSEILVECQAVTSERLFELAEQVKAEERLRELKTDYPVNR